MTNNAQPTAKASVNFLAVCQRFDDLPPGPKAELRRVAKLEDLPMLPALYRLFPQQRVSDEWLRVAFLLPWCRHREKAASFGAQVAKAEVNQARVLQVARAKAPLDLIQLRRLAIQVEPAVDWNHFGWLPYQWDYDAKRRFIEDYFIHQPK